jgi:hypothetical protein
MKPLGNRIDSDNTRRQCQAGFRQRGEKIRKPLSLSPPPLYPPPPPPRFLDQLKNGEGSNYAPTSHADSLLFIHEFLSLRLFYFLAFLSIGKDLKLRTPVPSCLLDRQSRAEEYA